MVMADLQCGALLKLRPACDQAARQYGHADEIFKSFVLVVVTSIAVSWFAKKIIGDASYGPLLIGMIGMVLVAGWLSAVLVCPELRIRLGLMINSYRFRARNF